MIVDVKLALNFLFHVALVLFDLLPKTVTQ